MKKIFFLSQHRHIYLSMTQILSYSFIRDPSLTPVVVCGFHDRYSYKGSL